MLMNLNQIDWDNKDKPALSVFGGGPHQCPGRGLTQFEARHIVYSIIKHFYITNVNNQQAKFDPGLTLRPLTNLKLNIKCKI